MTRHGIPTPTPYLWAIIQNYTTGDSPNRMGPADADPALIAHNLTTRGAALDRQVYTMGDDDGPLYGGYLQLGPVVEPQQAPPLIPGRTLIRPLVDFGLDHGCGWIDYDFHGRYTTRDIRPEDRRH